MSIKQRSNIMNLKCVWMFAAVIAAVMGGCASPHEHGDDAAEATKGNWRETFHVDRADLSPTGNNAYIPIQPGMVLKLAGGKDRLTVSVLSETKVIDGVTVGVLEEREEK